MIRVAVLIAGLTLSPGVPAAEPVLPLPHRVGPAASAELVSLGRDLFHDQRLSVDDTVSCATCHPLDRHGADGLPRSRGVNDRLGKVNAPTVFNAALHFVQFWDGRAGTLESQVSFPIHDADEMGSSWPQVLTKLRADAALRTRFDVLFDDGLTAANVATAIAAYQRNLLTPDSRFDRYLRGDADALTAFESEGWRLFKAYGCAACHQGRLLGGNLYARMGEFGDYFEDRAAAGLGDISDADLGRFNITRDPKDRNLFKVPSLRNVALTPPYFHDGSVNDLITAIRLMGRYQLGREIPPDDIARINDFLHTLDAPLVGR